MISKQGKCETCDQETTIYQITEKSSHPNGCRTEEWWACDPCASQFYDDMVETFGTKGGKPRD